MCPTVPPIGGRAITGDQPVFRAPHGVVTESSSGQRYLHNRRVGFPLLGAGGPFRVVSGPPGPKPGSGGGNDHTCLSGGDAMSGASRTRTHEDLGRPAAATAVGPRHSRHHFQPPRASRHAAGPRKPAAAVCAPNARRNLEQVLRAGPRGVRRTRATGRADGGDSPTRRCRRRDRSTAAFTGKGGARPADHDRRGRNRLTAEAISALDEEPDALGRASPRYLRRAGSVRAREDSSRPLSGPRSRHRGDGVIAGPNSTTPWPRLVERAEGRRSAARPDVSDADISTDDVVPAPGRPRAPGSPSG